MVSRGSVWGFSLGDLFASRLSGAVVIIGTVSIPWYSNASAGSQPDKGILTPGFNNNLQPIRHYFIVVTRQKIYNFMN